MEDSIFCPSCHLRNDQDSKYCTFCGASLDPFIRTTLTTREVTEQEQFQKPQLSIDSVAQVPSGALGLFVLDEEKPIILTNDTRPVILGRFYESAKDNLMDLSEYGAQHLGVSRRHARISYIGGNFVLQDLGSTNGTWINNQRLLSNELHQLRDNDIINLAWLTLTVCLPGKSQQANS